MPLVKVQERKAIAIIMTCGRIESNEGYLIYR